DDKRRAHLRQARHREFFLRSGGIVVRFALERVPRMTTTIVSFLLTALAAGVLGGIGMEAVLWLIGRAGWAKADMIIALGSLLTKSRDNAWRVGALVHTLSAIGFAMVYVTLLLTLGYTHMPHAMLI